MTLVDSLGLELLCMVGLRLLRHTGSLSRGFTFKLPGVSTTNRGKSTHPSAPLCKNHLRIRLLDLLLFAGDPTLQDFA